MPPSADDSQSKPPVSPSAEPTPPPEQTGADKQSADPGNQRVEAIVGRLRAESQVEVQETLKKWGAIVPFVADDGEAYVAVGLQDEFLYAPLRSQSGTRLLIKHIAAKQGSVSAKTVDDFRKDLQLLASCGPTCELTNRTASDGADLLVDMADGNQVRITAEGFKTEPYDRPRFRRHPASLTIETPSKEVAEPLALFKEVLGVGDDQGLLLFAQCSSALNPAISTPIALLAGSPGSGKTTIMKNAVRLVDPTSTPTFGELSGKTLTQIAASRRAIAFDNVGLIRRGLADRLCVCVTGAQEERRRLYTDREPVLFKYRPWVLLNGLDSPSTRPDFLDRVIRYDFVRRDSFDSLTNIETRFSDSLKQLRGALYEVTSRALATFDEMPTVNDERLADFGRWGRAVAVALNLTQEDFTAAYRRNRRLARRTQADEQPWLDELIVFAWAFRGFDDATKYTPTELHESLKAQIKSGSKAEALRTLPGSASALMKKINASVAYLHDEGVDVKSAHSESARRSVRVFRMPDNS